MAEPPDLAQLAKRYLDLWESQLTAFGSDPALLDQVARTVAAMGATLVAASGGVNEPPGENEAPGKNEDGHGRSRKQDAAAKARPPAAAAASPDGHARLDQLARQLADMERRLAGIEAALAGKPRAPRPRSRKARS
ncbi:hypothetical protein [Hypericibacter sp.]|uniref:hypothetical protein n=1 Tax=Hypericibacter sp. TaxID=2705401 RepID=UPI003D6D34A1